MLTLIIWLKECWSDFSIVKLLFFPPPFPYCTFWKEVKEQGVMELVLKLLQDTLYVASVQLTRFPIPGEIPSPKSIQVALHTPHPLNTLSLKQPDLFYEIPSLGHRCLERVESTKSLPQVLGILGQARLSACPSPKHSY